MPAAGALDADGGDELGGQHLLPAVRADVVELGEEDGVVAGGPDPRGDGRGAGDVQVAGDGGGLEAGVLAREVEGDADAEGGELGEAAGAADAGQGGHGGRVGAGRVGEALLTARQPHGTLAAAQARVGVGARAAQLGPPVGGVDASGAGHAEGGAGVGALVVLEVAVEPGADACVQAVGLGVAAVVASRPASRP